jgi:hypothetical protein
MGYAPKRSLGRLASECINRKYKKILNLEMERLCFENADKICLTSYETIDFYTKKYPHLKEKFEYYPNVYDPADIKPIATA